MIFHMKLYIDNCYQRYNCVIPFMIWWNMILGIPVYRMRINLFKTYFTKLNYVSIYNQLLLKGISKWWKSDNVVTVAWIIVSISSTKISLIYYDQLHFSNITFNCFLLIFILNTRCYIINKLHNNPIIGKYSNYRVLAIKKLSHFLDYYMHI